jgi:hypothetical protein
MRLLTYLLLLPSLAASPPARAELKVAGDLNVRQHRMAVLSATGQPDGAALIWDLCHEAGLACKAVMS